MGDKPKKNWKTTLMGVLLAGFTAGKEYAPLKYRILFEAGETAAAAGLGYFAADGANVPPKD